MNPYSPPTETRDPPLEPVAGALDVKRRLALVGCFAATIFFGTSAMFFQSWLLIFVTVGFSWLGLSYMRTK
ncbi:MAG: hypothetical protein HKN47_18860 [Pirellulaceae bacterium]|nr:hypothetical protein [Pirellulaceae bacterium]